MPPYIQDIIGQELAHVQHGLKPAHGKPLRGFQSAQVLEIAINRGGAFRAVYTVKIQDMICVLHCFQKKSSSGKATNRTDIELIKKRLAEATEEYGK